MDKKTVLAAFAIGLVLLFIVEPFAIGFLQAGGSQQGNDGMNSTSQGVVQGSVTTNVTILRYAPYVIASGNMSRIEAVKDGLVKEGIATYAIRSGDSLIVNVNGSNRVLEAADAFDRENVTVLSQLSLSTSDRIMVEAQGISVGADGGTLSIQAAPIYEPGARYEATFIAAVEGRQLLTYGSLTILPYRGSANVSAEVVSGQEGRQSVEVPWEGREAAKPIVLAEGAQYKAKSFININTNATDAQVQSAGQLGFATGARQGLVSVMNSFTDRAAADAQLRALGLEPDFPASVASFNGSGNASQLAEKLAEAGVNATIVSAKTINVRLPGTISLDGRIVRTGSPEFEVDAGNATLAGGNVTLALEVEANGNRLSSIASARIAE